MHGTKIKGHLWVTTSLSNESHHSRYITTLRCYYQFFKMNKMGTKSATKSFCIVWLFFLGMIFFIEQVKNSIQCSCCCLINDKFVIILSITDKFLLKTSGWSHLYNLLLNIFQSMNLQVIHNTSSYLWKQTIACWSLRCKN